MSIRVYELAKELKIDSTTLINKLDELDIRVKSHASTLSEAQAEEVKRAVLGPNPTEVIEQRLKPGIIRRRAKVPTKEEEEQERLEAERKAEEAKAKELAAAAAAAAEKKPHVSHAHEETKGKHHHAAEKVHAEAELKDQAHKEDAQSALHKKKKTKSAEEIRVEINELEGERKHAAAHPSHVHAAVPEPAAKPPVEEKKVVRLNRSKYSKPTLVKEQMDLLQRDEKKVAEPAPKTDKLSAAAEEDKKKRKKKKAGREDVVEEVAPVKKVVKKNVMRRREIITRQDFVETAEQIFRPGKKKKKAVPKKMMKKTAITTPKAQKRVIKISDTIQVGELARRMGIKAFELLKKLMDLGIMANINQYLDIEEAVLVAGDYGYEVENVTVEEDTLLGEEEGSAEDRAGRPPVVTVMGHVDHGKTTLLDTIRKTKVAEGEKGGITQHIGAYTVRHKDHDITFIDTPGHEAFTLMRARGAKATDIVVLVVAADDGVMDRTKEAINHAKDAEVSIIVAINKIDKPDANPDRVKKQLNELGLMAEDWGGQTLFVNVSAKAGTGVDDLLASILLQAEVLELRANPKVSPRGVILEARMDKGHGPVATTLVQQGTLKKGDILVAGKEWGKVRLMLDADGKLVKEAGPSHAVAVVGFSTVPNAGDSFNVVKDEKTAKQIIENRVTKVKEAELHKSQSKMNFDELYEKLQAAEIHELKIIVKADVQGSAEAVTNGIRQLNTEKSKINVIHSAAGPISENDVMFASASGALIVGFTVKPDGGARKAAEREGVEIKTFDIIYELFDEMRRMMLGALKPEYKEHVIGHAQVRTVFDISRIGKIAGSYISDGKLVRNARARVLRDGIEAWTGKIAGLKHFKNDVKEVLQGNECGIKLDGFDEVKEGDVVEAFTLEEVKPTL